MLNRRRFFAGLMGAPLIAKTSTSAAAPAPASDVRMTPLAYFDQPVTHITAFHDVLIAVTADGTAWELSLDGSRRKVLA